MTIAIMITITNRIKIITIITNMIIVVCMTAGVPLLRSRSLPLNIQSTGEPLCSHFDRRLRKNRCKSCSRVESRSGGSSMIVECGGLRPGSRVWKQGFPWERKQNGTFLIAFVHVGVSNKNLPNRCGLSPRKRSLSRHARLFQGAP